MRETIINILVGTYTCLLPVLITWMLNRTKQLKKERKEEREFIREQIADLKEEFQGLKKDFKDLDTNVSEERAMCSRYRIIRFSDEIFMGEKHSQDHFDQIFVDIDIYEAYCATHKDFKNNKGQRAVQNVKQQYDRCMKNHDFLDQEIYLANPRAGE